MPKFDPWPVFFRREWNRNWPFLVGFAITGTIITKFSLGLTEEDAKNHHLSKGTRGEILRADADVLPDLSSLLREGYLLLFSLFAITIETML